MSRRNRPVTPPARIHTLAVDSGRRTVLEDAIASLLLSVVVDVPEQQGTFNIGLRQLESARKSLTQDRTRECDPESIREQ